MMRLTKQQRTFRIIIIAIASIYVISVIERTLLKKDTSTEVIIEHAQEKAQMKAENERLKDKIHNYELELLKIRADVDDMSDDQLDSTWSAIFN